MRRHALAAALTLLAATSAQAALKVVATTSDFGAIATTIGGDKVSVATLASPSDDPHVKGANAGSISLGDADVLIESGTDLEAGWLPALLGGAQGPKVRLRASDGIQLLEGDPHFMMDPLNARTVAQHVAGTFCGLDARSCEAYKANLADFQSKLDAKMKEWSAALAPFKGRAIVTYHASWGYFAQRFGLVSEWHLEPQPGTRPTTEHMGGVMSKMIGRNVHVLLAEPFHSHDLAATVARRTRGTRLVEVSQFPADGDYLALIDADVRAIVAALQAV